ncbi:MAG TPA: LacI family DNA-binding transcriptional regulator [Dongiaceae bacterium]|nr:LacI family DNA-binding transcriptional regulator [Dongiaceae bacterium]
MTRLVDVAAKAGVSKSTVSNVIRGTALVAEETRRKVERAIADTGYRPNAIARALQAKSGNAVGIIVPDLTNPFYAQLAIGVERTAAAMGFAVLTAHTECAAESEIAAAHAFIERRVGGAVIGGMSLNSPLPKLLLDHDIPVTLAALGEIEDARPGVVEQDEAAAMEEVVEHLHALGHRRIAFVAHDLIEHAGERRRVGFLQAMRRRDLLPAAEKDATALVAHDDMRAIAAIDRLERAGRRVPHDISITGYDDVPLAAHGRIQLTTIRADAVEMGHRAATLITEATRQGRHVGRRVVMPSTLIVRASTAAPPA